MELQPAQNLRPEAICAAICYLEIGGSEPSVGEGFKGGERHAYKIAFHDHPSLCVRVGHPARETSEEIIGRLEIQRRIFQHLDGKGFAWSPKYCGASLGCATPSSIHSSS